MPAIDVVMRDAERMKSKRVIKRDVSGRPFATGCNEMATVCLNKDFFRNLTSSMGLICNRVLSMFRQLGA